ncbi:unnamed protein product [Schistocephalus solidus]|uniref:Uncharacterized protein n=1 Tax=Schistocephalus solidus TaxID=70667 RepID=A0A183T7Z9_SCHSO|nr:unnamed protein product [Schistocephalus solidus]
MMCIMYVHDDDDDDDEDEEEEEEEDDDGQCERCNRLVDESVGAPGRAFVCRPPEPLPRRIDNMEKVRRLGVISSFTCGLASGRENSQARLNTVWHRVCCAVGQRWRIILPRRPASAAGGIIVQRQI